MRWQHGHGEGSSGVEYVKSTLNRLETASRRSPRRLRYRNGTKFLQNSPTRDRTRDNDTAHYCDLPREFCGAIPAILMG